MENTYYIYIYLDTRKPGNWKYEEIEFNFQPFYIGRGKNKRIKQHLEAKQLADNSIKSNIINKIKETTGDNPIIQKIYENLSFDESNKIEIKLIQFFGKISDKSGILANMCDGGKGTTNFVLTKETRALMSEKAMGTKTYANNGMSKIVNQYTKEGILIQTFQSLREAGEKTGISFKNISSCCRGVSKTAGGFKWEYDGKSYKPIYKIKSSKRKKVYQYSLEGKYIGEWESVSEAEKITKIMHISCAALNRINFSGGFQWRYEKFEELPPLTYEKTRNINRYKNS